MRASSLIAAFALTATAAAVWYFGTTPMGAEAKRAASTVEAARAAKAAQQITAIPPDDLPALTAWLKAIPFEQRDQFVREKILALSPAKPGDRERIRAFLLSGADVEIEHPDRAAVPFSDGKTTLRRHFLGLLDEFPAAEAVPLAKTVLSKASDFREAHLALRALEFHQPDSNRAEALQTMQRILPAATQPAKSGRDTERYLAQFDRFAEPIAHYQLAEVHPTAMQAIKANPFLAGRYSEALDTFPVATRDAAYHEIFSQPEIAEEFVNSTGTRSVNVWLDPGFRQRTANFYAGQMNDSQRLSLLNSLGEDAGIHYAGKPLGEGKTAILQATDPAADLERAKARQAMLDALAPHSTKPELKEALKDSKAAVQQEIKATTVSAVRRPDVVLPALDPLGAPASTLDPNVPVTTNSTPAEGQNPPAPSTN